MRYKKKKPLHTTGVVSFYHLNESRSFLPLYFAGRQNRSNFAHDLESEKAKDNHSGKL